MSKTVKRVTLLIKRFGKLLVLVWVLMSLLSNTTSAAQPKTDVRILVDVSGSMKRNDPQNLRAPAVRLLSGLLPNGAKVGVWLFAEDVQSLSAVATVTTHSKKKINTLAKRIHNRGMFTNIGLALEKATEDWSNTKTSDQRIVILLTDGVVDISKDDSVNKQERSRIQKELIPQLKQLNARIYTIALSDEADKEILAQLSNSTDAWFEAVKTAEELEKVFLKIFEQSVSVPSLPITDNKFKVDASIEEFTALVFRSSFDPITLVSPSGKRYEADTVHSKISWFEENNFDLITMSIPEPGVWTIKGPVDPDNRVLIVSDLTLDVNNDELPANMLTGDLLELKVSLQEKGTIIKRATFLSLINFGGEISSLSGAIDDELILEDAGEHGDFKAADGIFGFQFKAPKIDEEVNFDLRISSPTFERVYNRSIRVYSTYVKFQTTVAETIEKKHRIEIIPFSTIVDEQSLSAKGFLQMPDGSELELAFSKGKNGNLFTEIPADNSGGNYTALMDIQGETLSGKKFKLPQQQVMFEAKAFEVEVETEVEDVEQENIEQSDEEPDKKEQGATEEVAEETEDKADIEGDEAGLSTMWWVIIGVVFNIVLFGGGFFGWKMWKKKQAAAGAELANALDSDDEPNAKKTDKKLDKDGA